MPNPPDVEAFLARERTAKPAPEQRTAPPRDRATAALARIVGRQVTDDARGSAAQSREPFAGMDRSGFVDRPDLGRAERSSLLRLLPRRALGSDLDRLDEQIAELEQRQRAAGEDVNELRQRLANAPTTTAQALAAWELSGQQGERPAPHAPTLEAQLVDVEATRDGLEAAVDELLERKAAFVERHRDRLVADADREVDAAYQHMVALVDELQGAREELVTRRSVQLWTSLYPDPTAAHQPQFAMLVGGLAKPTRAAIGVETRIDASRLLDLLRADAEHLRDAITAQQRAVLDGRDPNRPDGAGWAETPEGAAADRAEKREKLEAYKREWGHYPS